MRSLGRHTTWSRSADSGLKWTVASQRGGLRWPREKPFRMRLVGLLQDGPAFCSERFRKAEVHGAQGLSDIDHQFGLVQPGGQSFNPALPADQRLGGFVDIGSATALHIRGWLCRSIGIGSTPIW